MSDSPRASASGSCSRRRFLSSLVFAGLPLQSPGSLQRRAQRGSLPQAEQGDSLAGTGTTGTLMDPSAAGRPRQPTLPGENDAEIKAIEQQLACICGCTLDIFTCRTTDFTCTYSPALHREVLALRDEGKTAREILDAFVDKYGEKALMAPKPQGFNLWGYLLPGVAVGGAAVALAAVLRRREAVAAAKAAAQPTPDVSARPEELERLRRALDEVQS
jgi:cytochrome c-type biogenesis protein CcmH